MFGLNIKGRVISDQHCVKAPKYITSILQTKLFCLRYFRITTYTPHVFNIFGIQWTINKIAFGSLIYWGRLRKIYLSATVFSLSGSQCPKSQLVNLYLFTLQRPILLKNMKDSYFWCFGDWIFKFDTFILISSSGDESSGHWSLVVLSFPPSP